MWTTYYRKDYPKMMKFYDEKGYLLMRKEYFDNGKVKNYQNVKSPQVWRFGKKSAIQL
jgi:hypothetical protein